MCQCFPSIFLLPNGDQELHPTSLGSATTCEASGGKLIWYHIRTYVLQYKHQEDEGHYSTLRRNEKKIEATPVFIAF